MASTAACRSVKSNLLRRSPSVQQLRGEIRKQFQKRLKIGRDNELCRRRELFNNVFSTVTDQYQKIKKVLLDEVDDVSPEEMFKIMLEVEEEIVNRDLSAELNEGADNKYDQSENLNICTICNIIIMDNDLPCLICDNCAKLHFTTNF